MSSVPELDRLLEEHEVFRSNMAWERSERRFLMLMRLQMIAVPVFLAVMAFGWSGLAALPIAAALVFRIVPDPPRRDPFVRYLRK